ncbi:MAG: YHS domain-containing protein [Candidatus Atabeyarchaeum deiterrae]
MAEDPVCGMDIDETTANYKSEHMDQTYYFCSPMCKAAFDKKPMKYTGSGGNSEHSGHSNHGCGCC